MFPKIAIKSGQVMSHRQTRDMIERVLVLTLSSSYIDWIMKRWRGRLITKYRYEKPGILMYKSKLVTAKLQKKCIVGKT